MNERSLSAIERQLVEAARRVILDKGLIRATTREIARAAGCAEGTLYVHFRDKVELFEAVLAGLLPAFMAVLGPLPDRAGTRTVQENLTEVADSAIELYRELSPIGAAINADPELLGRHRTALRRRGGGPQKGNERVAEYLRAEQALGRVDPAVDPDAAALLLLGACYQYGSIWHLIDPEELPLHGRDPAAVVVAALLAGLSPSTQPSDRPTTELPV
jgi:AcrR family transcriptional regulator